MGKRTIGIVINVDTRPGYLDEKAFCGMGGGGGCRSVDFMIDNVVNKVKFFRGWPVEVTLYCHLIENLHPDVLLMINEMINAGYVHNFIINRDTRMFLGKHVRQYQDTMYLNALMLSRHEFIAHFDADGGAYRRDECDIIDQMINWIDTGKCKIVSYPSNCSPNEGPDQLKPGDPEYLWASTRFFFCRRDFIDYTLMTECMDDNVWFAKHNGKPHRYPNVTEQILGFQAGAGGVFYPPRDLKNYMIFSWHTYKRGVIRDLSAMDYDGVYDVIVNKFGGLCGACDVNYREIENA